MARVWYQGFSQISLVGQKVPCIPLIDLWENIKVTHGKVYDYLSIDLYYSEDVKLYISMIKYVKNIGCFTWGKRTFFNIYICIPFLSGNRWRQPNNEVSTWSTGQVLPSFKGTTIISFVYIKKRYFCSRYISYHKGE